MPRPAQQPLGLHLARVSRTVSRAFNDVLAEAGGSLPVWLVLISLKSGQLASQRELAEAVGVQGATLTHHLNAMESAGLVTRRRDPANRRLHLVELTQAGDELLLPPPRRGHGFRPATAHRLLRHRGQPARDPPRPAAQQRQLTMITKDRGLDVHAGKDPRQPRRARALDRGICGQPALGRP